LELEQLICLTLSSDITLFEKIASTAYRLRVDPWIKGKEDARSESEDSGSVDDDEDASSSDDESDGSQKMKYPEHGSTVALGKKQKIVHGSPNKCSEIDESYLGERWLLGLMEGEYSDLSIDEKLDCLVALMDVVSGAGSVLRLEVTDSYCSPNFQLEHDFFCLQKIALTLFANIRQKTFFCSRQWM
jgi:hypothetical protein